MAGHLTREGQPTDVDRKWPFGCVTGCGVVAVGLLTCCGGFFWLLNWEARLFFAGFSVLVLAIFFVALLVWARREAALAKVAAAMGFSFKAAVPFATIPFGTRRPLTEFFRRDGGIEYLMQGKAGPWNVWVLDYKLRTSGDRGLPNRTAVVLRKGWVGLPEFRLHPKGLAQKIARLFGVQHIDFEGSPEFSRRYTLRGPDEPAIRRIFRNEVRDSLASNPGWHIETGGGDFVVYRLIRRPARPREIPGLIASAVELREGFGLPPEPVAADEPSEDQRERTVDAAQTGEAVGVPPEEEAADEPPEELAEAVRQTAVAQSNSRVTFPVALAFLCGGLAMVCFPIGFLGLVLAAVSYRRARRDLREMDGSCRDPSGRPLALRTRKAAALAVGLNAAVILIWVFIMLQQGSIRVRLR
jgi:hypothetical protein